MLFDLFRFLQLLLLFWLYSLGFVLGRVVRRVCIVSYARASFYRDAAAQRGTTGEANEWNKRGWKYMVQNHSYNITQSVFIVCLSGRKRRIFTRNIYIYWHL